MYRAKLFLHPHTHHQKSSTVPGAYPSVIKGNNSNEFTRTIQLNSEKPSASIGRSSRNEAKGLFAGPNNGFFESPVMSRAHAEVRMILHPHRKIVIQDSKSMHGTFVNGLQLHPNETAELQEGTEVTFGAEVTRGEDVYPAKTFRCEVQWERMRSPSPVPTKARTGYGVTSQDLEYESGEDDYEMYDEDGHSQEENSSGCSSSPAPAHRSDSSHKAPEAAPTPFARNEEIPELHERTTKDTLDSDSKQGFELKSASMMDLIAQELRANNQDDKPRQRMSTIHSLVNKTQVDNLEKPIKVVDLIDVDEQEADALKIIDKPANFATKTAEKTAEQQPSKPVYIDLSGSDEEFDSDDEAEVLYELSDGESDAGSGMAKEEMEEEADVPEVHDKAPENETMPKPTTHPTPKPTKSVSASEPASPPEVMSSKPSNIWPGTERMGSFIPLREVASPMLPPIGRPQKVAVLQQFKDRIQQQATTCHHTRWIPNTQATMTESKREFFSSRADNFAKVSSQMNHGVEKSPSPFPPVPAPDRWSETGPISSPEWFIPLNIHVPTPKPMETPKQSVEPMPQKSNYASLLKSMAEQWRKESAPETRKADEVDQPAPEQECDQDAEFDDEDVDFEDNYYCEMESENDDDGMLMDHLFEEPPKTPKVEVEAKKNGYSKFSIDDMMNHESPKGKTATPAPPTAFASPPPSEGSADCGGEAEKPSVPPAPALENILNPAAVPSPPPTLKRKRAVMEEHVAAPPPQVSETDREMLDAPEVVVLDANYPELVVNDSDSSTENEIMDQLRPAKRARRTETGGTSFVKLATAAMAGAVMGGVGMFAALVASAQ